MRFKHYMTLILAMFIALLTISTASGEEKERGGKKFEMAIGACERGLQMALPKSKGSLAILQNLFKKYQRHRDAALKLDQSLKSSEDKHYTGALFVRKTFAEVYQTCERDFSDKVAKAETAVKKKAADLESRQVEVNAAAKMLTEQTAAAQQEVALAIDNYCATYLLKPAEEGTTSPLYSQYQTAKQKAVELYPDIVNQFHATTVTEIGSNKATNLNQTIKLWFEYCDAAFQKLPAGTVKPGDSTTTPPTTGPSNSTPATTPPEAVSTTGNTPSPESTTTLAPDSGVKPTSPEQLESNHATTAAGAAVPPSPTPAPPSPPEPGTPPSAEPGPTPAPEPAPLPAKEKESAPVSAPATSTTNTPPQGGITALSVPTPTREKPESSSEPSAANKDTAVDNTTTAAADDAAEDEVAEYKSVLAKMQSDRLKVLKEEKRLPDFVDDEDYNYQKATTWQYEKANGKKCSIYIFKENQLVKANKNTSGACPPFPTKD